MARLGRGADPCRTETTPIYGGESGGAADGPVERRLAQGHGSRAEKLAAVFASNPGWDEPIAAKASVLRGEVIHAVRDEMAATLTDVVLRRTGMGSESCPSDAQLSAVADCMAGELGWSDERRRQEILAVRETYSPLAVVGSSPG